LTQKAAVGGKKKDEKFKTSDQRAEKRAGGHVNKLIEIN
jgi:hypothetical protein